MPQILLVIAALIVSFFFNSSIFAQTSQQKTQDLISALAKTKYKKKEKKNVSVEVYVAVKNEPVVKNNWRDYAGVYESEDSENRLELRVSSNGTVEGNGYDGDWNNNRRQSFTLKDARIEGALLTATKVFADGATENFEAVFCNRTVSSGRNPSQIENRETKYGLGYIRKQDANSISRYFLELR